LLIVKPAKLSGTAHVVGSKHDFKIYEDSVGCVVCGSIKVQENSGFQGILRLHKNSETPKKKLRGGVLNF
jgi:hypothetical protein